MWQTDTWWDLAFEILPSTMGFSLAAFAVLLAFGNEDFLRVLSQRPQGKTKSALDGTSAAFFHFIFIQVLALLFAFVGKGLSESVNGLKWLFGLMGISDTEIADIVVVFLQHLIGLTRISQMNFQVSAGQI
jgi:hypothetical protein